METMTLKAAGELIGVSPATLRSQIRQGRLKSAGTDARGGHLVTKAEVERYRTESRGKPGARNAAAGGHARAAKLTPERRREIGRMGAEAARRVG